MVMPFNVGGGTASAHLSDTSDSAGSTADNAVPVTATAAHALSTHQTLDPHATAFMLFPFD
jgi:hypothetical protein